MPQFLKLPWILICSIVYLLAISVGLYTEHYEVFLIPIAILLIYLALFKLDTLYLLLIGLVPASVNIEDIGMGLGLTLPTEPIIAALLVFLILKIIFDGGFDKQVLKHPVTIIIFLHLAWILITSITSTMPAVSLKFFVSRVWFVATFYFLATQVFRKIKNVQSFFWIYTLPLCAVVAYTIINHSFYGFTQKSSNWVMEPFYSDHTSYGAILAFFFPFVVAKAFGKSFKGTVIKPLIFGLMIFMAVGIVLSYTRAAWLSLVVGLGIFMILRFKIKWGIVLSGLILLLGVGLYMNDTLSNSIKKNNVDSSSNFDDHIKSMSNVSSDASNLERINRWKCAYEMWKEKKAFGWGPGTYAFKYARFQKASDKTIISTNAGDAGNAHSEYLGPLSESGVLGMINMLLIAVFATYTGVKVYKRAFRKDDKYVMVYSALCLVGLYTYLSHGFLNNFLDTDKASAPFWGMIAMLVVFDLYQRKKYDADSFKNQLEELTTK